MIPEAARPEDEDALLAQPVTERRVVVRPKANRLYGTALGLQGRGFRPDHRADRNYPRSVRS